MNPFTDSFYSWRDNTPYQFLSYSSVDSISTFSYSHTARNIISDRLTLELEQRILLPIHKESKGKVIFEGVGKNLKEALLVVEGLNDQERMIFSDTIKLQLDSELSRVR